MGSVRILLRPVSLAGRASLHRDAQATALEPEDIQRRLFTFMRYTYHPALVANLAISPEAVYGFYCDRGLQELLLREFKTSYTLAQIPPRSFWANAAHLEMILWAYDLVLAFQCLCLAPEVQHWSCGVYQRSGSGTVTGTSSGSRPDIPTRSCSPRPTRPPARSNPGLDTIVQLTEHPGHPARRISLIWYLARGRWACRLH